MTMCSHGYGFGWSYPSHTSGGGMGNCNGVAVWPRHNQHLPPPLQPRNNPAPTTTTMDLLATTATEPAAAAMAAPPTKTMMGSRALHPRACRYVFLFSLIV